MDWIFKNIIANAKFDWVLYGLLVLIFIIDMLIWKSGNPDENLIGFYFLLIALIIVGAKELISYSYKKLYFWNQSNLNSIRELINKQQYRKALNLTEKIKLIKPQLIEKLYLRGVANLYLKESNHALEDFNSVEYEYSKSSGFFYHKGLALIDSEDIEKAIEYLTRSIELEKTWQNLDQRGVAYLDIGKLEEAEKDLRESIEMKEDATNTCNFAVVLHKQGQHKKAIVYYDKSISLDDTKAHVYYNRAMVHHFLKNWKLAIHDYSKAQEMGHKNNDLYLYLGYCKCENGEIENGLIDLKKANELGCKEAKELIEKYDNQ